MIELALAAALMTQDNAHAENIYVLSPLSENCMELEGDIVHQDCHLTVTDGRALLVQFTFVESERGEGARLIVQSPLVSTSEAGGRQRCPDGCSFQTHDFQTESFFYPSLQDVNSDGYDDILIPLITGNVNTEYALFIGTDDGFMAEPFSINGYGVDALADGIFKVSARGSAIAHYIEFYRVIGVELENIASVELSYDGVDDPDNGPNCRLVNGGETEGEAHYCGLAMIP
jgi:hypothetical protein